MAGVVGYLVQPEDTLWKIAKKYYTTVERIYEVNPELTGEPEAGTWLLLVKQAGELPPMPGAAM
ncbi:MAG: LysM peptidoglycan-binding domain-containing protein [Lachnospiraceae bacterium]|nr:LysM peptidoglycan-binding domain-containing protein [Lachnospiraceae bacterium]